MNIFINGQPTFINQQSATVADALLQFLSPTQQQQSFAIAVNSNFVAKADYGNTALMVDDCIDILFPIQGG